MSKILRNKCLTKLLKNQIVAQFSIIRNESNLAKKAIIYSEKGLETIKNIRREEAIHFDKTYHKILRQLSENNTFPNDLILANKWLKKAIEYNVPNGKRNRGLTAVISYHLLATNEDKTEENLENVRALGWALELFQAYFLIIDDIMDQSFTRRGQTCWYKQPNVGLMACNDATLIESGIYYLIKLYFKDKPYYVEVFELIHEIFRKTAYGQCLDMLSNPEGTQPDLSTFTFYRYSAIVKYKTSFYTCVLPVRLAMYLTNYKSAKDHRIAEEILLRIGHLFQVQDDYLDCFGDPTITGKIGTDIEDGKCCWNVVTALKIGSEQHKQILETHYGKKDIESVKRVKQVYQDLDLQKLFKTYEKSVFDGILDLIDSYKTELEVPLNIFDEPLSQAYPRIK